MSYHHDITLSVSFENTEQAQRFYDSFNIDDDTTDTVTFETESESIDIGNYGVFNVEDNKILFYGQTGYRCIGNENIEVFYKELKNRAKKSKSVITDFYLKYVPQEGGDHYFIVFTKNISEKAFEKFVSNSILEEYSEDNQKDPELKEDIKKFEKKIRSEYKDVIWSFLCGEDEISELVEKDSEGRTSVWEFEEELDSFWKGIKNEWKFPWDEDCGMWGQAIKNGEIIWENL